MKTKVCTKCGVEKSISEFNQDNSRKDGHRCDCKLCRNLAVKDMRARRKGGRAFMGVQVREKVQGSGVWWVFVNYDRHRQSFQVGRKKTAKKVADKLTEEIALARCGVDHKDTQPSTVLKCEIKRAEDCIDVLNKRIARFRGILAERKRKVQTCVYAKEYIKNLGVKKDKITPDMVNLKVEHLEAYRTKQRIQRGYEI